MINFRLYSMDYGVLGQLVHVGSVGGARYNITGIGRLSGEPSALDQYSVNWQNFVGLRFEENQAPEGYAPGEYIYTGSVIHGTMWQNPTGEPITYFNTCGNATGGDIGGDPNYYQNIKFSIHVKSYCNIAVRRPMDFGKVALLDKPLKASAAINVDCSAGTDFRVNLDKGRHFSGNSRHMANAENSAATIAYRLSPEEITGIGTGTPQGIDYDIDGEVPPQHFTDTGRYTDTVIVTLTKLSP